MGEACGTEQGPDTYLQTSQRNRHESGRCRSNLRILPPELEGQMLPWSPPDLWSEEGRGRMRRRGASWGGL